MASADLREELTCSVCLSLYTDPVTLPCGHNFCRSCIGDILQRQMGSGPYSCPDCRAEFLARPALQRNVTLSNIAEHFVSAQPEQNAAVSCTYCDVPVPAVKSCLRCETSMCDSHLRRHDRAVDHVLIPPTTCVARGNKCVPLVPRESREVSRAQNLEPDQDRKREQLKSILQRLTGTRKKTEKRLQSMKAIKARVQEKAAGQRGKVTALFIILRRQMDDLEKRALTEISRKEEQDSHKLSDLIRQLEIKTDELYSKILYLQELCHMTPPLPISQQEMAQLSEVDEGDEDVLTFLVDSDLDQNIVSETLHNGLDTIMTSVKGGFKTQTCPKLSLDLDTAGNSLILAGDLKTISWTDVSQNRPETPERFQYYQVLSSARFTSGQHCWEVETSKTGRWRVGVAYSTIARKGGLSFLGNSKKSWCLRWCDEHFSGMHDCKVIHLPHKLSSQRLRLSLDYEAGQLSFYELCDPIRHLHTFTATFTEPLHAAFCVWTGCMKILS